MNSYLHQNYFTALWPTTSSQLKHPKATVTIPIRWQKGIFQAFPTLGKHKKCIKTTVPTVGRPKIFIFHASQQWDCYKYSFLPRPNVGTTTNIHFSPRPTLGTTIIIHFFSRPNTGNTKKTIFSPLHTCHYT